MCAVRNEKICKNLAYFGRNGSRKSFYKNILLP
jgi:hypothetical protein